MTQDTYIETMRMINELKEKAEKQRENEVGEIVDRLRKAVEVYGISPLDVFSKQTLMAAVSGETSTPRIVQPTRGRPGPKPQEGARPPKYTDGKGGTWSGYGRKPNWFIDAVARGVNPDSMLLSAVKSSAPRAQMPAASTQAAAPLGRGAGAKLMDQQRVSGPAKKKTAKGTVRRGFRLGDKSWTGVGPKPRWFKDALASGKTLDELRA